MRGRLIGLRERAKKCPESLCRGSGDGLYTGKRRQHGKPDSVVGRGDQPEAGDGQRGRMGWRKGPYYRVSRVMPVEGRGLSSRRVLKVAKHRRLGQS
jgi:hypothetical protein